MTTWAISVAGVVLLTALCDVILPDGETKKYAKTVLSVIVVLVIVSPLPKLFSDGFSLETLSESTNTLQMQDGYLAYVAGKKEEATAEECVRVLSANGIEGASVAATYDKSTLELLRLEIYLQNAVIKELPENINRVERVKDLLARFVSDRSNIIVYDKY